jgi:hypothetical protein
MVKGVTIGEPIGAALCSDRTTHVYWNLYPETERGIDPMTLETMAIPNVTGPPQRHIVTGKDTAPIVEVFYAILEQLQEQEETTDDQSGPPVTCEQFEAPQEAVERQAAHQLHQRGEDVLYITWWLMLSEDSSISQLIRDMSSNIQYQDKQDMRQEVALRAWIRHIRAEQQGKRAVINGLAIRRLVQQWLEREGKAAKPVDAAASPEDAAKAKEAIEQERAAKRLEDWRHEVARLRAMAIQVKPPAASLLYTW